MALCRRTSSRRSCNAWARERAAPISELAWDPVWVAQARSSGSGGYNSSQSILLQRQLQQQRRRESDNEPEEQFGTPVFKNGDTVLVELLLPGEKEINSASDNPQVATQSAPKNGTSANGSDFSQQLAQQQLLQQQLAQGENRRFQEQPQRPIEDLRAEEKDKLMELGALIRAHNPYKIDANGELLLPGIPAIALAGLTEDLATRRASAEPALANLQIVLTRLPLKKAGAAALKAFGYDLFENSGMSTPVTLNTPGA